MEDVVKVAYFYLQRKYSNKEGYVKDKICSRIKQT
jgi:hypothetical protein